MREGVVRCIDLVVFHSYQWHDPSKSYDLPPLIIVAQISVTRTPQEEGATPFVDDKLVSLQLFSCSPRPQLITPQTLSQLEKRADF